MGGDNNNGGCGTTLSTSQGTAGIGIALGAGAVIASGGALLGVSAFGIGGSSLALGGVGLGASAAGLDYPECRNGNAAACLGLGLGATGAVAGIPEIAGAWLGVGEESLSAGILRGLSAFGFNVGIAGTIWDFLTVLEAGGCPAS